jgi:hypothetical protein
MARGELVEPIVGLIQHLWDDLQLWEGVFRCHLFVNDTHIIPFTTLAGLIECSVPGYGGGKLTTGWTFPVQSGTTVQSFANILTWTCTGTISAQWVYGYYVTDGLGRLRWAARDPDGPTPLQLAGSSYSVTPAYVLQSENSFS